MKGKIMLLASDVKSRYLAVVIMAACIAVLLCGCSGNALGPGSSVDASSSATVSEGASAPSEPSESETGGQGASSSSSESDVSSAADPVGLPSSPSAEDGLGAVLGSIAERSGDDEENPVVSEKSVRDIFSFTLEGKSYELSCGVEDFLDAGWALEPTSSNMEGKVIEAGNGLSWIGLRYNGDSKKHVGVSVFNFGSEDVDWKETSVIGVSLRSDMAPSFKNALGTSLDSSGKDTVALYGCNSSVGGGQNRGWVRCEEDLLQSGDTSLLKRFGSLAYQYDSGDDSLKSFEIELNYRDSNPLVAS